MSWQFLPSEGIEREAPKTTQCKIAVVGSGRASLHVLALLPEPVLKDTVVVDNTGTWLHRFREWCGRLDIQHLRSPVTQCPHSSPTALHDFLAKSGSSKDVLRRLANVMPLPPAIAFLEFCEEAIINRCIKLGLTLLEGIVTHVQPISPTEDASEDQQAGGRCQIELAGGDILIADAVVYSAAHQLPVMPAWMKAALKQTPEPGSGSLLLSCELDVRDRHISGRDVAVVGGGMTSGQLALAAVARGARHVTLLCRRALRRREFECAAEWVGGKRLRGFRQLDDPREALHQCRQALHPATLNTAMWRQLQSHVKAGVLTILQGQEVVSAAWDASSAAWSLHCGPGAAHKPPAEPMLERADAPLAPVAQEVWVACGSIIDIMQDPVLEALQTVCPTRVVGGYPVLCQETLVWPGLSLYVIGRAAMLAVGPCAGTLPGMRLAAERVVQTITTIHKGKWTEMMPWHAVASRLGASRGLVEGDIAEYLASKPKAPVLRSAESIDVDDLDPDLPRKEVSNYKFTDDGEYEICVICPLGEPITADQMRVRFGEKYLEMWAIGADAAYHLHIPKLYGKVVVEKCKWRLSKKTPTAHVYLHKQQNAEWPFLKS